MPLIKKIAKLTIKQKCEILEKLSKGESVNSICRSYSINKSTVSRIKKREKVLKNFVTNSESGPGKRCTLRKAEYPKMEKALHKWFLHQRARNMTISGEILKEKARSLHKKIREKSGDFNASDGWLKNFKKRFGIRYLKLCGEKLTNKPELIDPFKDKLKKKIDELGLTPDQIYNADESGLNFRLLPDHTYVSCLEKSAPGRKVCKERITFLPCTNASGTHRLKLMVIGKSAHPRAFKNFHKNPVIYKANRNAWMTMQFFEEWFQQTFVPEVREYLGSKGLPKKAILLLDNASCHPQEGKLQSDDGLITKLSLPPNCTALLQPMDQNIIHLIKVNYKKSLLADLIATKDSNLNEKLKKYDLKKAVCNLANAWDKIPSSSIQKSWNNLMFRSNFDWDEEDLLPLSLIRTQIIEENIYISSLLQEISPEVNFSLPDINQWVNELSTNPNESEDEADNATKDIIESVVEEDDENYAEEETDVQEQKIKEDDAIISLSTSIQWAYENERPLSEILVLKNLREIAIAQKISKPKKQSKIFTFFNKS